MKKEDKNEPEIREGPTRPILWRNGDAPNIFKKTEAKQLELVEAVAGRIKLLLSTRSER